MSGSAALQMPPPNRIAEKSLGRVGEAILSLIYSVFRRLACWLKEDRALKLGIWLNGALYSSLKQRRLRNYQAFFGAIDPQRDERIDEEFIAYMARVATEGIRETQVSVETFLARTELRGQEHLDEALKLGKGVILLGSHVGNFYAYHQILSAKGYSLTNISQPLPIPSMERQINRIRKHFKITSVFVDRNAARAAVKAFRENRIFSILFDVLIRTEKAFELPFGASRLKFDLGPALLAARFGVPIVPLNIYSDRPFHHRVEIQPALPPPEGSTVEERAVSLLKLWRDWLEGEVRKRPGQWWYWSFMELPSNSQAAMSATTEVLCTSAKE